MGVLIQWTFCYIPAMVLERCGAFRHCMCTVFERNFCTCPYNAISTLFLQSLLYFLAQGHCPTLEREFRASPYFAAL